MNSRMTDTPSHSLNDGLISTDVNLTFESITEPMTNDGSTVLYYICKRGQNYCATE